MKNDTVQHPEAYRIWQTYALGKELPRVIAISRQGEISDEIMNPSVNAIYEHLAFEDEMLIWQYIEENYLNKYHSFICLRFEWSFLSCWQIDFPGSEQLGEEIMPEELNLPKTVLDELDAWHSERDQLFEPWDENNVFDYDASEIKGLAAALSMRPYLSDHVYFEYNLFREITMMDGLAVELPIPSFIVTICHWRPMIKACLSGNFERVKKLVDDGVDLNLIHPCKAESIFTEFMTRIYHPLKSDDIDNNLYHTEMVTLLITLGADIT